MKNFLIIITGPEASGKSTIARFLSEKLQTPQIQKDDLKEILFDTVGYSDKKWSKKLSSASYELMYYFLGQMLKNKKSLIMEANFYPEDHNTKIQKVIDKYKPAAILIICKAKGKTLFERFKKRALSGKRHPGHVDEKYLPFFRKKLLKKKYQNLNLKTNKLVFDSTNAAEKDLQIMYNKINKIIMKERL